MLAHEMGHIHQALVFDNASREEQQALKDAHNKWLKENYPKNAKEYIEAMRGRASARVMGASEDMPSAKLDMYWRLFDEWYADQTARWALSADRPVTIVEKFFSRLGKALRDFYNSLRAKKYLPDETFAQYIEKVTSTPSRIDLQPEDAKPSSDEASQMVSLVPQALQKGFSPTPGGTSRQMANGIWEGILKLRTQLADKGAFVFDRISKEFNDGVNTALKGSQVEAGYRQAESSGQLLPQFYRLGAIAQEGETKLWEAVKKDGIRPPTEIIDLTRQYAKDNDLSFDDAWKQLSDILQAGRE